MQCCRCNEEFEDRRRASSLKRLLVVVLVFRNCSGKLKDNARDQRDPCMPSKDSLRRAGGEYCLAVGPIIGATVCRRR